VERDQLEDAGIEGEVIIKPVLKCNRIGFSRVNL